MAYRPSWAESLADHIRANETMAPDYKPDGTKETETDVLTRRLRKHTRYWLFRFRNEAGGGAPADGAPKGMREWFERAEGFTSWAAFGVSWDVSKRDPTYLIPRGESLEEEWRKKLLEVVPIFPGLEHLEEGYSPPVLPETTEEDE